MPAPDLDASRFEKRVSALEARLDALREQAEFSQQLAAEARRRPTRPNWPPSPTNSKPPLRRAEPRQAKTLLRLLIKELRVNARSEILPTSRVVTPAVCARPSSVGGTCQCANTILLSALALDAG